MSTRDLQLGKVLLYPFFFPFHHHQLVCCCICHEFCVGKTTKTLKFECRAQKVIGMLSFFFCYSFCLDSSLVSVRSLIFFSSRWKKTYLAITPWDDLRKYLVTLRSFQPWASDNVRWDKKKRNLLMRETWSPTSLFMIQYHNTLSSMNWRFPPFCHSLNLAN